MKPNDPQNPRCTTLDDPWYIYDRGCDDPKGTVSAARCSGTFAAQEYCGCDGVTFKEACPLRPYRHVGACKAP